MIADLLGRRFARVWDRPLDALRLEVRDPFGRGLLHGPRPLAPRRPGIAAGGGGSVLEGGAAASGAEAREGGGRGNGAPPTGEDPDPLDEARRRIAELSPEGPSPRRPARGIGLLVIRPAWGRDHLSIDSVRRRNALWLNPWEATMPPESDEPVPDIGEYIRRIDREQREGRALVMVCEADGEIAGQFSVSNVVGGAMSQGMLGYWLAREFAGIGLGALGAAMVVDLVIGELGLHRIEVDVRPENVRSLGVCRRLGLREEGLRPRFMHINGEWADHLCFSIDREALPEGGLVRSRILREER